MRRWNDPVALAQYELTRRFMLAWDTEYGEGDHAFALVCPEVPTPKAAREAVLAFHRDCIGEPVPNPTGIGDVRVRWVALDQDEPNEENQWKFCGSDDPRRRFQLWQVDTSGCWDEPSGGANHAA